MPKKSDHVDDEPIDGEPEAVDEVVEPAAEDGEWRYDRDADDPKPEGAEEWTRPPLDEVADE